MGQHAGAQQCDDKLAAALTDSGKIFVTESSEVSRKDLRKEIEIVKEALKAELRIAMAEKLLTEVRSVRYRIGPIV
jgi:hypothetical protein